MNPNKNPMNHNLTHTKLQPYLNHIEQTSKPGSKHLEPQSNSKANIQPKKP